MLASVLFFLPLVPWALTLDYLGPVTGSHLCHWPLPSDYCPNLSSSFPPPVYSLTVIGASFQNKIQTGSFTISNSLRLPFPFLKRQFQPLSLALVASQDLGMCSSAHLCSSSGAYGWWTAPWDSFWLSVSSRPPLQICPHFLYSNLHARPDQWLPSHIEAVGAHHSVTVCLPYPHHKEHQDGQLQENHLSRCPPKCLESHHSSSTRKAQSTQLDIGLLWHWR